MYLSRIQLTPHIAHQSQLGLMLRDRNYSIHRLLWDLFDSGERFLFREENGKEQRNNERRLPLYYVLSNKKPALESPIFDIDTKPFKPLINKNDQLAFKLRANPTIARREEGKKHSQRHDVVMDAKRKLFVDACKERGLPSTGTKKQLQQFLFEHSDYKSIESQKNFFKAMDDAVQNAATKWIAKRGEYNGYHLDSVQSTSYRWNALPEKSRNAGFSSMDYEGVLTVQEPESFINMLNTGLGPSKAFGCALMLIRRL